MKKKSNFSKQKLALKMKLWIISSTIIPTRIITVLSREKQEISMNKEKKQNKYLYKADGKSLSLKNRKNKENSKQCSDFQNKIKTKTIRNKQAINLIKQEVPMQLSVVLWWLSRKQVDVKVFHFLGARNEDINK